MMVDPVDDSTFWYNGEYTTAYAVQGNWATRIFSFDLSEDTAWPYAFAGNDTVAINVLFFETQGEAENYSSIIWSTSGDGNFISNYAESVTYLRGPGDLENGQVTLTMHLTGYYPGTEAADSMVLYLQPVGVEEPEEENMILKVFPNPSIDVITIVADIPLNEPVLLKIFSETGKMIFTGIYSPHHGNFEQQFDLTYLPDGVYFVKVMAGGKAVSRKIILVR
jgi:hypothetical protein